MVALHGPKKWSLIASGLPNKGSKQCRRRWQNYLNNTDAKSGGWTADEVRVFSRCSHPDFRNRVWARSQLPRCSGRSTSTSAPCPAVLQHQAPGLALARVPRLRATWAAPPVLLVVPALQSLTDTCQPLPGTSCTTLCGTRTRFCWRDTRSGGTGGRKLQRWWLAAPTTVCVYLRSERCLHPFFLCTTAC